jgi:hypothetical protein
MWAGWAYNVKHHKQLEYYHNYEWDKCSYFVFHARIHQQWLSYDDAIKPESLKWQHMIKTRIDENGRVCTKCKEYKLWDYFARTKWTTTRRTPDCLECRKQAKIEYRERTGRIKDREYKQKTRILQIGEKISFMEVVYIDWLPRDEIWEVVDKKKMQWYRIKSLLTGYYKTLDTTEWNINYKKYYKNPLF